MAFSTFLLNLCARGVRTSQVYAHRASAEVDYSWRRIDLRIPMAPKTRNNCPQKRRSSTVYREPSHVRVKTNSNGHRPKSTQMPICDQHSDWSRTHVLLTRSSTIIKLLKFWTSFAKKKNNPTNSTPLETNEFFCSSLSSSLRIYGSCPIAHVHARRHSRMWFVSQNPRKTKRR